MYKKIILPLSLIALLSLSGCGGSDSSTDDTSTTQTISTNDTTCSTMAISDLTAATRTLNNSQDFSASLLQTSEELLSLSNSLIQAGSTANTEYVNAMLQLSEDIGDMADRILEMADKILEMSDKIGDMADKIVETQKIQSQNVALTQANLLKAQENFKSLLK